MNKKGVAHTYFKEVIPDIQKRVEEYKTNRSKKKNNIEINRLTSKNANDIVGDLLR